MWLPLHSIAAAKAAEGALKERWGPDGSSGDSAPRPVKLPSLQTRVARLLLDDNARRACSIGAVKS